MSTQIQLDLSTVAAESEGIDLLTEGNHLFEVKAVEIKENKKKTGYYLATSLQVVNGVDAGKSLTNFINFAHSNADTVESARRRIKKILQVGGHANPEFLGDASEMIGLKFVGQVVNQDNEWTNDKGEKKTNLNSNLYKVKSLEGFVAMESAPVPSKIETAPAKAPAPAPQVGQATPAPADKPASAFPWAK